MAAVEAGYAELRDRNQVTIESMIKQFHADRGMAPVGTQATKIVWDAIDRQGRRMIDQAIPAPLRSNTHENEMRIRFRNGSVWQVVGSDNYDQLVGTNPVGLIFSEYASRHLAAPAAADAGAHGMQRKELEMMPKKFDDDAGPHIRADVGPDGYFTPKYEADCLKRVTQGRPPRQERALCGRRPRRKR